jgi:hypothetical protein
MPNFAGDWVKKLKEPRRDVARHWYESWLGDAIDSVREGTRVLSICTCSTDLSVEPAELEEAKKNCVKVTPETCMP